MRPSHRLLVAALIALIADYALWFGARGDWVACAVFIVPAALFALGVWRGRPRAAFWSGVAALAWFSHGVMVAWTRPPERAYALVEAALAVAVVLAASVPGLRSRFARRR